jgi:hypothetical protein
MRSFRTVRAAFEIRYMRLLEYDAILIFKNCKECISIDLHSRTEIFRPIDPTTAVAYQNMKKKQYDAAESGDRTAGRREWRTSPMGPLDTFVGGSEAPGNIPVSPSAGPFSLADEAAYRAWRAAKLAAHPTDPADLYVTIADPFAPSAAELEAIARACERADMCVYRFGPGAEDEAGARRAVATLAAACGLFRFEKHRSAGPDGIVPIEVASDPHRSGFIPYSTKPIGWHTDGYYAYEGPERAIRAMVLHCVRPAETGGVNALLDHEIAYIRLRDRDPALVEALMRPNAMSIPPAIEEDGSVRGEAVGPVFEIDPATGGLLMRYTARKR